MSNILLIIQSCLFAVVASLAFPGSELFGFMSYEFFYAIVSNSILVSVYGGLLATNVNETGAP